MGFPISCGFCERNNVSPKKAAFQQKNLCAALGLTVPPRFCHPRVAGVTCTPQQEHRGSNSPRPRPRAPASRKARPPAAAPPDGSELSRLQSSFFPLFFLAGKSWPSAAPPQRRKDAPCILGRGRAEPAITLSTQKPHFSPFFLFFFSRHS